MAMKSAPLETFLTTVSPTRYATSAPHAETSPDVDAAQGARAILLTILSKEEALSDEELQARSELPADFYKRTLAELTSKEFVVTTPAGISLTPAGRLAADQERTRLLTPW